jgi:hypothetical protein
VAHLPGLLELGSWQKKIPGLRIIERNEPLHPRLPQGATEREKQLGHRYQLVATNTGVSNPFSRSPDNDKFGQLIPVST